MDAPLKESKDLYSLDEIFENRIFRIPDYQRGYSWKKQHVEALWEDIMNIIDDKIHYTGMISVQKPTEHEISKWKIEEKNALISNEYYDFIHNSDDKSLLPYYIVDGQQRLTTIILLLVAIRNCQKIVFNKDIEEKYIFINSDIGTIYIFGYEFDSSSYEYLKSMIGPESNEYFYEPDTNYAENIQNALTYFREKLKKLSSNAVEAVLQKTLNNLRFNFFEIPKQLNIFMIFETMNYRGKTLTSLELLKNRLIYLVSVHPKHEEVEKVELRNKINQVWNSVYIDLAREKNKIINDDDYLRVHWLMYFNQDRKNTKLLQQYKHNLLEEIFIKSNFDNPEKKYMLDFDFIDKYISSLEECACQLLTLRFPFTPHSKVTREAANWLRKINRLSLKSYFEPIILAALVKGESRLIELLKNIERHIFIVFGLGEMRSNTNKAPFLIEANKYFRGEKAIEIIIEKLKPEIKYKDKALKTGEPNIQLPDIDDLLFRFLKNRLKDRSDEGYLCWKKLDYFFHEYELHIRDIYTPMWNYNSKYALIFPPKLEIPKKNKDLAMKYKLFNETREKNWQSCIQGYGEDTGQMYLTYTLGNIILVNKESKEDADDFEKKKEKFENETYSSMQVIKKLEWTPVEILERGIELLLFMEMRWRITIDYPMKKQLLYLNKLGINDEKLVKRETNHSPQLEMFAVQGKEELSTVKEAISADPQDIENDTTLEGDSYDYIKDVSLNNEKDYLSEVEEEYLDSEEDSEEDTDDEEEEEYVGS